MKNPRLHLEALTKCLTCASCLNSFGLTVKIMPRVPWDMLPGSPFQYEVFYFHIFVFIILLGHEKALNIL
jgi:hypothetical protein